MDKKEYKKPSVKVVELNSCDIICTSGTLGRGRAGEPDEPNEGPDGYIYGE